MNPYKLRNIINLSPERRYRKFIADVANSEEVWILENQSGVLTLGGDGYDTVIPLWSEQDLGEVFKETNKILDVEASTISIYDLIDEWIVDAIEEGQAFAVLPLPNLKAPVIKPEKLKEDLEDELDKY